MRSCAGVFGCHRQRIRYSFGAGRLADGRSPLRVFDKAGVYGKIHHPESESRKEGSGDRRPGEPIPQPDVDDGDVGHRAELQRLRFVPRDARDFESGVDRDILDRQSNSQFVFDYEQAHVSSPGMAPKSARHPLASSIENTPHHNRFHA